MIPPPLPLPLLLTLTLTLTLTPSTTATPCTTNANCPPTHYCPSAPPQTCTPIPFAPVVAPTGPATTGTNTLTLLMLSDVQPYYIKCKEAPYDQCIFNTTALPLRTALENAMERQAQCAEHLATSLSNVVALFDNGDITNAGLKEEVDRIELYHGTRLQTAGVPLVVQLGNHDYKLAKGADAVRTIAYFETAVRALGMRVPIRSMDYSTTGVLDDAEGRKRKYSTGSFCYSIEWNNYVFITLHWATAQGRGGLWTPTFEEVDERNGDATHNITVTDPTTWILDEVADADSKNKSVVLMPHSVKGLNAFTKGNGLVKRRLHDAKNIIAVIAAHDHDAYGRDGNWRIVRRVGGVRSIRKIPLYYTGSVSYEKMIAVKLKSMQRGIAVTVYDSRFAAACNETGSSPSGD